VLKLVIQLHLKIPISSKLLKPNHHGAGLADYFQRYRHFVPEFSDETLFRCFLVEFGQHVRRTMKFDAEFKSHSNWWSGASATSGLTFVSSTDGFGVLVKLDKHGLVQFAKSLAQGTFRVLDDYCCEDRHSDFLSRRAVGIEDELQEYLEQIPPELEEEEIEKERLPNLKPLRLVADPEATKNQNISATMLAKRPPGLDDEERQRLERKRKNNADYKARKKAEKAAARSMGRVCSFRRKIIVRRSEL
jgi:hypothetical protein